jgi:uncharacterized protein (UPF0261 family)
MDTKSNEARFVADVLTRAGATPWIVDLSMKSHTLSAADIPVRRLLRQWACLGRRSMNAHAKKQQQ